MKLKHLNQHFYISFCEDGIKFGRGNLIVDFINILQYEQLLRQYSFDKKLESQTVIREKLCKALSYEKGSSKVLMK